MAQNCRTSLMNVPQEERLSWVDSLSTTLTLMRCTAAQRLILTKPRPVQWYYAIFILLSNMIQNETWSK